MTQLRSGLPWGFGILVAGGLLAVAGGTLAEDGTAPPDSRTFGTSSVVVNTVQAFAFQPILSTAGYTGQLLQGALSCQGGACGFIAPVSLPAGALVTSIEGEVCDTDAATNVGLSFVRATAPGAGSIVLANAASTGTPGCVFVTGTLTTPETIENRNRSYYLLFTPGPTSATRFFAARIFYSLQVSPAPAVATFADVPTGHPFFRFVQTLAAAGSPAAAATSARTPR